MHRICEKRFVFQRLQRHAVDEITITQRLIHPPEDAGLSGTEDDIPWHGCLRTVDKVIILFQRLCRVGGFVRIDFFAFFDGLRQEHLDAAVFLYQIDQLLCGDTVLRLFFVFRVLLASGQAE